MIGHNLKNIRRFFAICSIITTTFGYAQEEARLEYIDIFKKVPSTSLSAIESSFSKAAIPGWGLMLGATAITYHYDEKLYSYSQQKGRDWGIGNEDNTSPLLQAYGHELVRVPTDTGSFLYFLGDGWMHFAIAGSMVGASYASGSTYDFNTGIMIAHGMVVSTIFNQALKRSFGRESPEVKTSERGSWNLFPSFNDYNTKTASYDGMPSGHVMTATLTFTILAERYSQYQTQIYTVGGVWISALAFQMMNNGVHWASDYPLGIAMGWVFGKAAVGMVAKPKKDEAQKETSWMMVPSATPGGMGVYAYKSF